MATQASSTLKARKPNVLGRSVATGRLVLAPVSAKQSKITARQIEAAVKSVLAKKD